jgi:hypothetical protein
MSKPKFFEVDGCVVKLDLDPEGLEISFFGSGRATVSPWAMTGNKYSRSQMKEVNQLADAVNALVEAMEDHNDKWTK